MERANVREITVQPSHPCDDPQCESCQPWTESRFDVVRVDDGAVLLQDVAWMRGGPEGLPSGAMFWQYMTESPQARPRAADDYAGLDEEHIERIRKTYQEYPDLYPAGSLETEDPALAGLPRRQPSHLFQDGPQLVVILPGGYPWNIDSRASNCGKPYDYRHRCWRRHGEPPDITVDKSGRTCAAGAGSIAVPGWHGFLRDGMLVT